jgi:hypothetical protein
MSLSNVVIEKIRRMDLAFLDIFLPLFVSCIYLLSSIIYSHLLGSIVAFGSIYEKSGQSKSGRRPRQPLSFVLD